MMDKKNETALLYDALLSVPGMSEPVKIDLRMERKIVLLFVNLLESGLSNKDEETAELLAALPQAAIDEINQLLGQCLEKAGLTGLNEKLKSFR